MVLDSLQVVVDVFEVVVDIFEVVVEIFEVVVDGCRWFQVVLGRSMFQYLRFVCLLNELVDDISVGLEERDYVVDVAFPNEYLYLSFKLG